MANDVAGYKFTPPPGGGGNVASQEKEIDLGQVLELVRSGKLWLMLFIAAIFLVGLAYTVMVPPTYSADGLVQVEEQNSSGSSSTMESLSSVLQGSPVQTEAEIQILQSRMILGSVVDSLNLTVRAMPELFPLIGNKIFRHNSGAKTPVDVPGFLRHYAWGGETIDVPTFEVPDQYHDVYFALEVTQDGYVVHTPNGGELLKGKIGQPQLLDRPDGHFALFVRRVVGQPGTRFKLMHASRQNVIGQLKKKLTVDEEGKQSGVIRLTFKEKSPTFVQSVINRIEDAYLAQNVERRSADAAQALEFLQKQLPKLKEQVNQSQGLLNQYQVKHGSADVTEETRLVLEQSVDLEKQRLTLEQQREEALQRFTAEHPTVKALNQQIQSLEDARDKIKSKTERLPTDQQEIFSLTRDLEVNSGLYTTMLNTIQQLQLAKAGTVGNVRIIDVATFPLGPIWPKAILVLPLSIVLGFLFGIGFLLIQRALQRGVDDPAVIENHFGLTTYALIPFARRQRSLASAMALNKKRNENFILASVDGEDVAVEALRSLRTSLHFALLEASNNIIMLTGPTPSLGKSFVTINLGAVLALAGKRVVIVDADLRMGHLSSYISAAESPGVSDYVAGDADLAAIVRQTPVELLSLIPRGVLPPNPAELLMHERFAELTRILSASYDYVLIDTPPVLAVTDATIVGRLSGCTLLVLKSGQHVIHEIDEVVKRLRNGGVNLKGVLFNQVGAKIGSYGYGTYGTAYGYGKRYGSAPKSK
jgi:tyrosine-protein kinase Etk/Wzc